MTPDQQRKAARLFAVMWDWFLDGGGVDGGDLQNALDASGLTEQREATKADLANRETDYEVGDMLTFLNDDGKALLAAAKEPAP